MIKTIIFDFGDVFINLDKSATLREFSKFGTFELTPRIQEIYDLYEVGQLTTTEFITNIQKRLQVATETQIINAWNAILLDFPKHRLDFIRNLALKRDYMLILLSNTNELHIDWIKKNISFYNTFESCFDAFYLSHEIHLRKPNADIFEFVLNQHQLKAEETIFIDDTIKNTDAASQLGIHIWNNNPVTEDITNLFIIKSDLF